MKSDLNFAQTVTWYTFPLPHIKTTDRVRIIEAGVGILDARAEHPSRTLVEHYAPLTMDPKLVKAHEVLDRTIDHVFGQKARITDGATGQRILIDAYLEMAGTTTLDVPSEQASGTSAELAVVRAWAIANGFTVSARGRLPDAVQDAYEVALRSI
jgi:hypothetical protein